MLHHVRRSLTICLPLSAVVAMQTSAAAQFADTGFWEFDQPLYTFARSPIEPGFGATLHRLGDADLDGIDDLLIAVPGSHREQRASGAVYVRSMGTGALLYARRGHLPDLYFALQIGVGGDASGDGTPDWLASDARSVVTLHSGVDGTTLHSWPLTSRVSALAVLGDVDGDGIGDVLIGSDNALTAQGQSGAAWIYSGANGSLVRKYEGAFSRASFGRVVLALEDVDGDGVSDYGVGAGEGGFGHPGKLTVYSGAAGEARYTLTVSSSPVASFGREACQAGDLDGDGRGDLWVLDPGRQPTSVGRVHAYSSADGSLLYTFEGVDAGRIKGLGGRLPDVDGDGIQELLLHVVYSGKDGFEVRSGEDGTLLRRYHGPRYWTDWGDAAGLGDIDGDGLPEFAASAFTNRTVVVASTATRTALEFCEGELNLEGERAVLEFARSNSLAENDMRYSVRYAAPWSPALLFWGPRRAQIPLGQGLRCVGGPLFRLDPVTTNGNGYAGEVLDFTSPGFSTGPGALRPGSTWAFQVWYRDGSGPGASNLSSAVSVPFRP